MLQNSAATGVAPVVKLVLVMVMSFFVGMLGTALWINFSIDSSHLNTNQQEILTELNDGWKLCLGAILGIIAAVGLNGQQQPGPSPAPPVN